MPEEIKSAFGAFQDALIENTGFFKSLVGSPKNKEEANVLIAKLDQTKRGQLQKSQAKYLDAFTKLSTQLKTYFEVHKDTGEPDVLAAVASYYRDFLTVMPLPASELYAHKKLPGYEKIDEKLRKIVDATWSSVVVAKELDDFRFGASAISGLQGVVRTLTRGPGEDDSALDPVERESVQFYRVFLPFTLAVMADQKAFSLEGVERVWLNHGIFLNSAPIATFLNSRDADVPSQMIMDERLVFRSSADLLPVETLDFLGKVFGPQAKEPVPLGLIDRTGFDFSVRWVQQDKGLMPILNLHDEKAGVLSPTEHAELILALAGKFLEDEGLTRKTDWSGFDKGPLEMDLGADKVVKVVGHLVAVAAILRVASQDQVFQLDAKGDLNNPFTTAAMIYPKAQTTPAELIPEVIGYARRLVEHSRRSSE